jgi:diketogulonate reductase-like aldo/keto reductase
MFNVPKFKLNNGNEIPQVGCAFFLHLRDKILKGKFQVWSLESHRKHLYNTIKAGYRLFDGAFGEISSCFLLTLC